jgi:circadian clock protein KaiB
MTAADPNNLPQRADTSREPWQLQLFVAGESPSSVAAIRNAHRIVEEFLPKGSTVTIVDLAADWDHAEIEQVLAIPTLIRRSPAPPRRIIGDLHDLPRVLVALGVDGYSGIE